MKQRYTSAETSINNKKAPAIYGMKKAIELYVGKKVIDIGGGKYDTPVIAGRQHGADVSIYDPYNRTEEHNKNVLSLEYDVAIISNVLNVIAEKENRLEVVKLAISKADTVLITVYEGDKTGNGRETKKDCYQLNQKTPFYEKELLENGFSVNRYGKLIIVNR